MANSSNTRLVYKDMPSVKVDTSIDIVLTPQDYILKKEQLPITKEYQAKKIAKSIFDNLIDDTSRYDFFVYKDKEDWVFIAYSIEDIKALLQRVNIPESKVKKIFFIEQFKEFIQNPISLANNKALIKIEDTIAVVAKEILPIDTSYEKTLNITPSNRYITISKYDSLISYKQALMISAIFVVFGLMYILEGTRYHSDTNDKMLQEIYDNYPSLQSSYTRDSILSKYRVIDKNQKKKRDILKNLSYIVNPDVHLDKFELVNNHYEIELTSSKPISSKLLHTLKTRGFNFKKLSDTRLAIKGDI